MLHFSSNVLICNMFHNLGNNMCATSIHVGAKSNPFQKCVLCMSPYYVTIAHLKLFISLQCKAMMDFKRLWVGLGQKWD